MKNVNHVSTKQHGGIKSGISQSKNSTILEAEGVTVKLFSHKCVKVIVLGIFVAIMVKLQQFVIIEPNEAAINTGQQFSKSVSTICDKPVCTRGTL